MVCLPLDFGCMLNEWLAPAIEFLWITVQISAFVVVAALVFLISRKIYKGRYVEANALIALWAGYFAYTMAAWFAIFGAVAAIVVLLLAIFTPFGGVIVAWLITRMGGKPQ